ncbi:hypothetical protein BTA51_08070 [Hahella sp. CCB-MM4]|uniref:hypothetical protein n=1 Tax=Hahella sp. (strain CCB-MM4) TaxID=1926491 RepID=UPI000B9B27BD|nr:hypothetical protein [Hahella sp. CCB-MM4]OZG73758.1 hypothetical protein BTA51_08070 [Hahella sp. CCB-MM4]
MVQAILSLLIVVPAFIIGVGLVPIYWIALPVAIAYVKAILSAGEAIPGQDFSRLSAEEFHSSDKNVKAFFVGLVVIGAAVFGLGKLVAWVFL